MRAEHATVEWTPETDAELAGLYTGLMPTDDIADRLGVSIQELRSRIDILGLKVTRAVAGEDGRTDEAPVACERIDVRELRAVADELDEELSWSVGYDDPSPDDVNRWNRELACRIRKAVGHVLMGVADDAHEALGDASGWDDAGSEGGCTMEDLGTYIPRHEFRRMSCKACGAVHWEQPQRTLPAFQFCPRCGRKVERWEWR